MGPAILNSNFTVKVLLVDDLEENLLALEGLLRRDGLQIFTAKSGTEALELLLTNDFALAILDVQMPEMDGFELAELMRWSVRTRQIPIIFVTAGGIDERRKFRGYEAGAVDFLFKPIEPTIMQGKADVFIALYRQRQEVVQQRDILRSTMAENARLYDRILKLNESLEERVKERTNELTETNELLLGFTYSVAVDFRQHIQDVAANAEIVLAETSDCLGGHRENVAQVLQIAKVMDQMTEDLLSFAHTRNITLRLVDIDLTKLACEIASACQLTLPATQSRIANGLRVLGDPTLVRILVKSLLDNAFKFSQHAVDPLVEVGQDEQGFFVQDNGIGFDMIFADKIFLPFERLHGPTEFSGLGIGLANAKSIVDRLGGVISVSSMPQKGTTVHFSLKPRTQT